MEDRNHKGTVLDVSHEGFDSGASTFATVFADKENPDIIYMFYTGAENTRWSRASIGMATSRDGINFTKADKLNPLIENQNASFCSEQALCPAVTRVGNHYYMVLAGKPLSKKGRRVGIACASDPKGPWKVISELIRSEKSWEGNDIDLGPCVAKTNENELMVYYSNVSNKRLSRLLLGPRYLVRKIGILKLKINSPSNIEAYRHEGNPLKHLNGAKGTWNESLFCPGYIQIQGTHYLFPTTSTYSAGFPNKQFIGMVTDYSPYFQKPQQTSLLIDGPAEKHKITPPIRSEIALDTPCPLIRKNKLFLYYAVMDRADHIWKTALTVFNTK